MSSESNIAPAGLGARTGASMDVATEVAAGLAGVAADSSRDERRLVWDLPVRIFHWLFAASILASWGTAELGFSWMKWHIRLGYWMIGLLSFRVLWGFVGPRHARFTSFLKGPRSVWRYAKGLAGADEEIHTVGHNPLGGLMVIIMLLLVSFQVSTGLFATDDIAWTGPYYPTVSNGTAEYLTGLHHFNFNLIWAAIGLHIGAILYYAFIKRQNLVPAMLHGHKPAAMVPLGHHIPSSQLWKAFAVMVVSAAIVYAVFAGAPQVSANSFSFG